MDIYIYYFLVFIAGVFIGSFLNLVADRSLHEESILFGRSHCDFCKKELGVFQLIPVFSFIFQKGKCAYCAKKLSWYYPLSELITGFMLVVAAYFSQVFLAFNITNVFRFVILFTIFSFYIVLFLTDLKEKILPNKVVYSAILAVLVLNVLFTAFNVYTNYVALADNDFGRYIIRTGLLQDNVYTWLRGFGVSLFSAFCIALFFIGLIVVTKGRGMGGGDVKLGFLIGVVNGFPNNVLAIFLGFFTGAIVSIALILVKRKSIKDTIAFGPFLIVGSVISLFYGSAILGWYYNLSTVNIQQLFN